MGMVPPTLVYLGKSKLVRLLAILVSLRSLRNRKVLLSSSGRSQYASLPVLTLLRGFIRTLDVPVVLVLLPVPVSLGVEYLQIPVG